jgi:hypothetical protein
LVRLPDEGCDGSAPLSDLSYLWRGWFELTSVGRAALNAANLESDQADQ